MNGMPPPKPPRTMLEGQQDEGEEEEGEGGRTLWQICWNEDREEPVVTMVDISKIDLRAGSHFQPQASLDEESGDVVVFEKNADELEGKIKKGGSIYKKPFNKRNWEGIDLSPEGSLVGRKFLLRSSSDPDLDLIPPRRTRMELCARARWCCTSCRTRQFWSHYWWIPVLIFGAVFIYVLVTLIILRATFFASP